MKPQFSRAKLHRAIKQKQLEIKMYADSILFCQRMGDAEGVDHYSELRRLTQIDLDCMVVEIVPGISPRPYGRG